MIYLPQSTSSLDSISIINEFHQNLSLIDNLYSLQINSEMHIIIMYIPSLFICNRKTKRGELYEAKN